MADLLPNWETGDVERLREFADIRLLVFDLDGTLLDSARGRPPSKVRNLPRSFARRQKQLEITVATGRAFAGVRYLLADLNLLGHTPVIIYNGSVVWLPEQGKLLHRRIISENALKAVVGVCQPLGATIIAYFFPDPLDLALPWTDVEESVSGWSNGSHDYSEYNGMSIDWQEGATTQYGTPVSLLVDMHGNAAALGEVRERLSRIPSLSCTSSGYSYVEVRPADVNKGHGLALTAHHLGLSSEQVLAIGDNDNDVEMLRWAGIGVAVSSASEAAIANSRYMCHHGAVQGVVEVMRLVHMAKRYYGVNADASRRGA